MVMPFDALTDAPDEALLVLYANGDAQAAREAGVATQMGNQAHSDYQFHRAAELIKSLELVNSCTERDGFLVIESDTECGNAILAELIRHEVRIIQFAEDEPNLEEIFMRSTAGKVT